MNDDLQTLMQEATRLTQAGRLSEATGVLQRALGGWPGFNGGEKTAEASAGSDAAQDSSWVIDGCVFEVDEAREAGGRPAGSPPPLAINGAGGRARTAERMASRDAAASAGAAPAFTAASADAPRATGRPARAAQAVGPGQFNAGHYRHGAQSLEYKLYVPPAADLGHALPLVVMLHGCTQNPDDFAAGTAMNEFAREQGFLVVYPAQSSKANPQGCWNWFKHTHQQRGRGEPALIAGLVQQLMKEHAVDARRVYIAGLSAGGAMAAIVAGAYPDIFAAVGVHSGLASGSASNVSEALAVMKSGAAPATRPGGRARSASGASGSAPSPRAGGRPPVIVFHGDQDHTVHQRNGEQVIAAALGIDPAANGQHPGRGVRVEHGTTANGRRYTRSIHHGDTGSRALAEHWVVHGAGHAWSGGRAGGSYTDAKGPDATREMLRFFFEHPHGASQGG